MSDDAEGGLALIYLHGYGQPVDQLLPSAFELARQAQMRIFLPAGPLRHRLGGPAWWHFDQAWSGGIETGDEQPPEVQIPAQLVSARVGVQQLLREIRARHRPQAAALVGYSQGAMLSVDVAAAGDPPVDRVVALSGQLLAASLPAVRAPRPTRTPVLVVHGRSDGFSDAELLVTTLRRNGHSVILRPFDGGHVLPPPDLLAEVGAFVIGR